MVALHEPARILGEFRDWTRFPGVFLDVPLCPLVGIVVSFMSFEIEAQIGIQSRMQAQIPVPSQVLFQVCAMF